MLVVSDARDVRIAELEKQNAELRAICERLVARENDLLAIIAKQQSVIATQQELIADLQRKLIEQEAAHAERAAKLEADVARLEKQLLGPKTEKIKVPPADRDDDDDPSEEELARRREQAAAKRRERALAKNAALVTEQVDHDIPDELKRCSECKGTTFTNLGYDCSTTYEYVPGRFVRRIHRRQKAMCSCKKCFVMAPGPPKLVAGGQYGFGFAAFLIVEKCCDSIPIHRIEKRFARLGVPMSRATMNDVLHTAAEVTYPLVERLEKRIGALEIVLADETSMKMQDRTKRGFFWVFHGRDEQSQGELVLYSFAADRSGDTPARILGGTEGCLLVDGYTGYNAVTDPDGRARAGCWCHLRRKLFEAQGAAAAMEGIDKMRPIFRVEHDALELQIVGTAEHLAMRQGRSKPAVTDFFAWAEAQRAGVLPKSPLGEALRYAMNQRSRLELFLTDARIPPHNNGSERRLRVVALGRRNFLFVGHPRAGRNFACLYSLVGSCIANGVEPTQYLTDVLPRIRDATTDAALDALLPDRWQPLGPAP